jgi:hypothetical protein
VPFGILKIGLVSWNGGLPSRASRGIGETEFEKTLNSKHEILIGNQGTRISGCRIPGIRISGKAKD